MKKHQHTLATVLCAGLLALPMVSSARDVQLRDRPGSTDEEIRTAPPVDTSSMSAEDRLQRLERMMENQGLVNMMLQLQDIQQELQRLRGEVEVQTHTLEELKKRQRELYVDIDRRLLAVERHGGRGGVAVDAPKATTSSPSTTVATTSSTPAVTAPVAASAEDEQKAYQKAFDLLRALRYDKAIQSFREFIRLYPNGRYAHIAQYWIGEANYAQRRFEDAVVDYQALLDNYTHSPKLAEAMLKIGYSQFELKQYDQARDSLERLIKAYPGTTEAGQGQNLLQKIKLLQSQATN